MEANSTCSDTWVALDRQIIGCIEHGSSIEWLNFDYSENSATDQELKGVSFLDTPEDAAAYVNECLLNALDN